MSASATTTLFDPYSDPVYMKARHLLLQPLEKILIGYTEEDAAITAELVVNFINEIRVHDNKAGKKTLDLVANNLARKSRSGEPLTAKENFLLALLDRPLANDDKKAEDTFFETIADGRLKKAAESLPDAQFVLESFFPTTADKKSEELPEVIKKGSVLALCDAGRKDKDLSVAYYWRACEEGSAIGALETAGAIVMFEKDYMTKAAERGHWQGLVFLAKKHEATDVVKAAAYYHLAALGHKHCRLRNDSNDTNATPAFELSKLAEKHPHNPQVQYFYFLYFLQNTTLQDKSEELAGINAFKTFLKSYHDLFCKMLHRETEDTQQAFIDYLTQWDRECAQSIILSVVKCDTSNKNDSKLHFASGGSAFAHHLRRGSLLSAPIKESLIEIKDYTPEQQLLLRARLALLTGEEWKDFKCEKSKLPTLDVDKLRTAVTLVEEKGCYYVTHINSNLLTNMHGSLVTPKSTALQYK